MSANRAGYDKTFLSGGKSTMPSGRYTGHNDGFIECGIGRNVFVECNLWEFKIGLKM